VRNALGSRVEVVSASTEIAKGVFLLPCGRREGGEPPEAGTSMHGEASTHAFLRKTPGGIRTDDFSHELMLAAVDRGELVVITGCSHSGIMEMIAAACAAFPGLPVRAVIGGFHLTNPATRRLTAPPGSVSAKGRALAGDPLVRQVFSGHCTGDEAYDLLKREMGGKLGKLETGMRIEL